MVKMGCVGRVMKKRGTPLGNQGRNEERGNGGAEKKVCVSLVLEGCELFLATRCRKPCRRNLGKVLAEVCGAVGKRVGGQGGGRAAEGGPVHTEVQNHMYFFG